MWHMNTLEYYLDLKRSGIWTPGATWTKLDKIMWSGSSLSERPRIVGSVYMKCPEWANAYRDRK